MQGDLTTLDRAQAWLAPDQGKLSTGNDPLVTRLISAVSRIVMNYMQRDTLARIERVETYEGGRTSILLLRQWPVLSVGSVAIAPSTALATDDYSLEAIRPGGGAQRLYLANGRTFYASGPAGVGVTYTTGFVSVEQFAVPDVDGPQVTVAMTWLQDDGVTLVDGTPVDGYTVADGVYTFPDEIGGEDVIISYSYVPADIEQAVIQEIGMLVRSKGHIGESSRALPGGGGTQAYLPVDVSAMTKVALNNYRRVAPQ